MQTISITINERLERIDAPAEKPLLWVLREDLNLVGTKYGCGIAACGACTVLVNGKPVRSCVTPLQAVAGQSVTTIEGLSASGPNAIQRAWIEHQVAQCGYCQPGFILAATALMGQGSGRSEAELNAALNNLCRCGSYPAVREALTRVRDLANEGTRPR
ncbi:MAG: (2Fe-2S)-binding protein [Casimicrobiaceae bacterium]|nr:(2Fe-2S)-binding protein [Casimicrobiaceae bacterium]MDW8313253.1 (2Fe-2S)-binding protein [Burkholderiales bacterium]